VLSPVTMVGIGLAVGVADIVVDVSEADSNVLS
jgi:hypothetical protein